MFALWRKEVYLSHLTFRFVPRLFNWNVSVFINCQHCTQAVKNSPAMQETLVRSLGWEDPLGNVNPLQYSYLENFMDRGAQQAPWLATPSPWGYKESDVTE